MKKITIYILKCLSAIFLLSLISCDDYLNTPPSSLITTDGFYKTPAQADQAIAGVYAGLRHIARDEYLFMSEIRSDNVWVNPIPNAYREFSEIGTFRGGKEVVMFNTVWNTWYKVIADANMLISKLPEIEFHNETFKNQLEGEVHFLRGWSYFELVRLFGNIPIIDKVMSPNEVGNIKQSSTREIYDKIILPDMLKAKELLPVNANLKNSLGQSVSASGRADKIAAQAMLGRIYLTIAGFPLNDAAATNLAEAELQAVIQFSEQNGEKYWAPDYLEWQKQWMAENNNKYSIFAIQFRSGGTGNSALWEFGPGVPLSYTSWGIFGNEIWIEKSLMYEFSRVHKETGSVDRRGNGHTTLLGYEKEGNFSTYSNPLDTFKTAEGDIVDVPTRTIPYKYLNSLRKRAELGYADNIETSMRDFNDWPVNCPVIRLEDVLLMYAEIQVQKGNISKAMEIVNRIRLRAGCDPATANNPDEAMYAVKRERQIEFCLEGIRWFDIVRWGEWKNRISAMFSRYNNPVGAETTNIKDGRHIYPIPMTQMDIKPGLYTQNQDY